MANIPSITPLNAVGATEITPVVVGLTNTLIFNASAKQVLYVANGSAAAVTLTLKGSLAPASIKVPGTGSSFNSSAGASVSVAPGKTAAIPLANFNALLAGDVTLGVSAIASVTAWLVEV